MSQVNFLPANQRTEGVAENDDVEVVWMLFYLLQEEKDGEPPKDTLDDLFPNDEEENSQGSK